MQERRMPLTQKCESVEAVNSVPTHGLLLTPCQCFGEYFLHPLFHTWCTLAKAAGNTALLCDVYLGTDEHGQLLF